MSAARHGSPHPNPPPLAGEGREGEALVTDGFYFSFVSEPATIASTVSRFGE